MSKKNKKKKKKMKKGKKVYEDFDPHFLKKCKNGNQS